MTRKKHQDTVIDDAIADARGETPAEPEALDLDAPPPPDDRVDERPPLRVLTVESLATSAQSAYLRTRGEPRDELRWQAAVRAVLAEFGAVNRGEAEPDGDLFTLVELP